jgi:large subunit ribosomal protein L10e
MALRPGRVIKRKKRPWTRVSTKKPRKSYVVGVPFPRIHVFEMGNKKVKFDCEVYLVSKDDVQIRHNALEAARIVSHKFLEKKVGGANNYFYKILVYPHNVIREKPIATGAGADRFSQGMRKAFGKPVGRAAIVKAGQRIIMARVNKQHVDIAKQALKRASSKMRCRTRVEVKE